MAVTTPTLSESYYPADQSEPVLDTTVGGILRDAAQAVPDQPALIGGHPDPAQRRRWTYGELLEDAERCARALLGRFAPGERVAVWAPNIPEWEVVEFGAALAGLILVTVNPAYKPGELKYVLEQSGSAGIFLLPEFRGNPMAQSLEAVRSELPGSARRSPSPTSTHFWRPARPRSHSPTSVRTTRSRSSTRRARPAFPRARSCTTAG